MSFGNIFKTPIEKPQFDDFIIVVFDNVTGLHNFFFVTCNLLYMKKKKKHFNVCGLRIYNNL